MTLSDLAGRFSCLKLFQLSYHHITPQPLYGPLSGTTRVSRC